MADPLDLTPIKTENRIRLVKTQDVKRPHIGSYLSNDDMNTLHQLKQCRQEKTAKLQQAMQAVKQGGISQRKAAMRFSIPRSTLHGKIFMKRPQYMRGYVDVHRPPLSYENERELFRWINNMVRSGFDVPHRSLEESARTVMMDKQNSTLEERETFKKFWLERFLQKWTKVG